MTALAHKMPSSQFSEWMEFYRQEPFGSWWQNFLMAQPTHILRQVYSKKGQQPNINDLFYKPKEAQREQAVDGLRDFFKGKAKKGKGK